MNVPPEKKDMPGPSATSGASVVPDESITPIVRLHLWLETDEGMLWGLGRVQLLSKVDELGSLNKAAKALGMSYRAAWGRIKNTEEQLGGAVLEKRDGRKGYVLSDAGRELLVAFDQWFDDVERYAQKRASELFPWRVRGFAEAGEPESDD